MTDFKLWDMCFSCKKKRFFVGKRYFNIPGIGRTAMSREFFCGKCFRIFKEDISSNINAHGNPR